MTALVATLMWRNRRACRGERMSDKIELSDVFTDRAKNGAFPPKGGFSCPFPSSAKTPSVGKSEFMGFRPLRGRNAHNFGIPIHNLWDERRRNLWDPSIICGTALQPDPFLTSQA